MLFRPCFHRSMQMFTNVTLNFAMNDQKDIIKQCRLCMEFSLNSIDIFDNHESVIGVQIMIQRLFSFWISDNDRIKSICEKCIEKIKDYDIYHNMVLNNQININKMEKHSEIDSKIIFVDRPSIDDEIISKNKSRKSKNVETSHTYPTELIKNGKFIIGRIKLEELASRFYNIQCDLCKDLQKFTKLSDMLKHVTSEHDAKGFVTCCNIQLYRRDLIFMHMAKHLQPSAFECPICQKKVTRLNTLKNHLETHLPAIERSFKCDQCDRSYTNNAGLNYHRMNIHIPKEQRTSYDCETCKKSFTSSSTYYGHMRTHRTPKYLCSECGRNFRVKQYYLDHLQTHDHDGKNRVQCQYCGFVCKNKLSFRYHMKLHNKERFNCPLCQFDTHRKSFLNRHMITKHTDIKPYSCDICGKSFKLKSTLKNHIPQHTGEQKYSCSYCPKKFTASSNYYKHLKSLHYNEYNPKSIKKQFERIIPVENNNKDSCIKELTQEKI